MVDHFEILICSILIRPDKPAVLLLGDFRARLLAQHRCAVLRCPPRLRQTCLFPNYMWDPKSISKYFVDPVLASPLGHELISEILVAYFQSKICTAWSVATGSSYEAVPVHTAGSKAGSGNAHGLFGGIGQRPGVPEPEKDSAADAAVEEKIAAAAMKDGGDSSSPQLLTVPSGQINTRPNGNRPFEEIVPFCFSANDLINPLPPSLFYGSGWYTHHPSGSGGDALITAAHYWHSALPTSKLTIPIQVGGGDIGVYYLREPVGVLGRGVRLSVGLMIIMRVRTKVIENAADRVSGGAIPTYVPFFLLFLLPQPPR